MASRHMYDEVSEHTIPGKCIRCGVHGIRRYARTKDRRDFCPECWDARVAKKAWDARPSREERITALETLVAKLQEDIGWLRYQLTGKQPEPSTEGASSGTE